MQNMHEWFYNLRTKGHNLENSMKDLSDVAADGSLANSPAVKNLIAKIQFVMDRACTQMKYTQEEDEQVADCERDLKFYREENVKLAVINEALTKRSNDLNDAITSMEGTIVNLQKEIGYLKHPNAPEYEPSATEKKLCDDGQFVESIKHLRARTGLGLSAAKLVMEQYRDRPVKECCSKPASEGGCR